MTAARRARTRATRAGAANGAEEPLILAMPKGRVQEQAIDLFGRAGYDLSALSAGSRQLVFRCGPFQVISVRGADVPTYVEQGAADVGIAGSDVLDEGDFDLYVPLDLGIGRCRMVAASKKGVKFRDGTSNWRLATKYPRTAQRYLDRAGTTAEVVTLSGSIELAPWAQLADVIIDITETGETLRQNRLVIIDEVAEVSSHLVVNRASMKMRAGPVGELLHKLAAVRADEV